MSGATTYSSTLPARLDAGQIKTLIRLQEPIR